MNHELLNPDSLKAAPALPSAQLTMLGVGSSAGTPAVGCRCATCLSSNPKNKRTRCSAAITLPGGQVVLIDTGPDLRQQALREGMDRVDAVIYTHTHADHMHGIDDLRAFCQLQRKQIPLYGSADTTQHIASKFAYTIREPSDFWDLPVLSLNTISAGLNPIALGLNDPENSQGKLEQGKLEQGKLEQGKLEQGKLEQGKLEQGKLEQAFQLFGVSVTPIPIKHGNSDILGFRIGKLAYLTDVSLIPETSLRMLEGLDVLMLDCLRYKPHFTHIHLEQSLKYASHINANSTYLIHMTHEMEYEALSNSLPPNVYAGYDGLKVEFNV